MSIMENVNNNDPQNLNEKDLINNEENHAQELNPNEIGGIGPDGKPLPKIHPHLHNTGKYKMYDNHSVSDDIPKTKTGI